MNVLILTKLFPNAAEPLSAPFNRQQFAALAELCDVEVLATIPWFPGLSRTENIPRRETLAGLDVAHPRTLYVPRVGHAIAAPLYAASVLPEIVRRSGDVDVVLGSWGYPDGCAAVALARALGVPAVVKLHGSDMNVVARMRGPRWIMSRLLPRAARVVAVSRALADEAAALGVARERIALVYNGVDGELFRVRDRAEARRALGLAPDRRLLLYVGHLKETKGVIDLARAFEQVAARADDVDLVLVGDGAARAACETIAERLGDRMRLAGSRPLEEIPQWMAACDVLALPSWNEGTPNVVLEALACGRRVVATAVGGVPDVVTGDGVGMLVPPRDPRALADALTRAARAPYDPREVARLGSRGDWAESAAALHQVLRDAVG